MKKNIALSSIGLTLFFVSFLTPYSKEKSILAKKVYVTFAKTTNVNNILLNCRYTPELVLEVTRVVISIPPSSPYFEVHTRPKKPIFAYSLLTNVFQEIEMRKLDSPK